jgi:hypothetical protein
MQWLCAVAGFGTSNCPAYLECGEAGHEADCFGAVQAAANAKENLKMSKLNLYISECYADQGPSQKRFTNGYKGRCAPVSCHYTFEPKKSLGNLLLEMLNMDLLSVVQDG